tara:strand:- start:1016 stop:1567 length:552 start_codon:yes stop_codon:yes gene_type:complete
MARQYAFKKDAQKSILGIKTELESAPGYFIVPRKYTVTGDAVIKESASASLDMPESVLEEVAGMVDGENEVNTNDLMKKLTPISKAKLLKARTSAATNGIETTRLVLLHGIGAHNFYDGEDELSKDVTDDLIKNIMDYADITNECLSIIGKHNTPLAQASEETSETPPNGYTSKQISEEETVS